jgi:AbrB family looped-hinge helix DNA binding protein
MMKPTGIIRGIDEVGRFSIPKEIRKKMDIQFMDKLEVFIDGDTICLRKYDANKGLTEMLDRLERYVITQCNTLPQKDSVMALIRDVRGGIDSGESQE